MATFIYLSVLITFLGFKFFKLVLYKKALLGKNRAEIRMWLEESDDNMDMLRDTEIKREEIAGSIIIALGVLMLLLSFKDDPEIKIKGPRSQQQ